MKRIIYKYKYIAVVAAMVLSIVGCNDFLDRSPQGVYTQDDDLTGGTESKIFGIYALMRSYNITAGIPAFAVHMFRSEDSEKGSTVNDGSDNALFWDDFEYNTTNGILGTYWNHNYQIINNCNTVIDTIQKMGKDELKSLEAEARFFRAYCFFNLVRAWGDVPKIDFAITNVAQVNIPKSPASEIYELIDADLIFAAANLPLTRESKYLGRLTWGAAKSLHARTYMMRNNWTHMLAASKEVINSNLYNLDTPVDQVFTDAGENSGQSIYEIQCISTSAYPASTAYGSQFCQVQGVRGAGQWNLGWGWHMGTTEVAKAFEPGDPRKDASLLYFRRSGEAITPENTNKPYGESPVSDAMGAFYNKKAYTAPAMRSQFTKEGFWVNIRIIRYPDVLLMAAEAANELGQTEDALKYLEMVRAHARGASTTILPKVTTQDQVELRTAIQRERRAELALEPDRFYDLVRWGIAKTVLHAAGKTKYEDKHALLPIPQSEIDKSNGVLKQNPNYQ